MRGLRFIGQSKVEVAELPDPTPGDDEVLVRIRASAVCGSELGSFRGPDAQEGNGGHEAMGEVVDPNGSNRFRAGDRVGIATLQGCGDCHWCLGGMPAFCDRMKALGNSHSEYAVSGERWLIPLPGWLICWPYGLTLIITPWTGVEPVPLWKRKLSLTSPGCLVGSSSWDISAAVARWRTWRRCGLPGN